MNILDIIIAKKKSFTGETESLVRRANEAMAAANEVAATAEAAADALEAAQAANETAQSVAENLETLQSDLSTAATSAVNDILSGLDLNNAVSGVAVESSNTASYKKKQITVSKQNGTTTYELDKHYTSTGTNEDGGMTQKAVTEALNAQKAFLENKINNIPSSGGGGSGNISGDLADAEPGRLVVVSDDGGITASSITESELIKTQMALGSYIPRSSVGVEIDYDDRSIIRAQEAIGLSAGADFDQYPMYGGRKRCLVADDGTIIAFSGEDGYVEDGSLGQVMVYQPKFYYMRMPLKMTKANGRTIINKEILYISALKQSGFTIHPLFLDSADNELDYVLLPAYEGSSFDVSANSYNLNDSQNINFNEDLLCSIAGAKPISGASQTLDVVNAAKLASNRGTGWKLTNLAAESLNQMLMIIEFGSLNLQTAFNKGITSLANNSLNISCFTGSTSSLGSASGMASSSSDNYNTYTVEGKCAISYRGVENPYGNIWRFIGDVKIVKNNNLQYLTYKDNHNVEKTFASAIPAKADWISYFGYDEKAPWAFVPAICDGANSAVPVGDFTYVENNSNEEKCCVIGGKSSAGDYAGPFYYGMDYAYHTSVHSYNGCLMYQPEYDTTVYFNNIMKWRSEMGGD